MVEQDVLNADRSPERGSTAVVAVALAMALLVACGAATPVAPTPAPLDGTFTASGGGGALPAVQALAARFKELHPGVTVLVSESGSNAAIKLVLSNTIDVGFVSRALTDAEKQQVMPIPIGFSGTAVVVNVANPVTGLTRDQLRKIYGGEITSWADLVAMDQMVRPYMREPNAATRQTFETYLFAGAVPSYGKNVIEEVETEAMLAAVNSFRGAIGIASTGSRTASDRRVKTIQVDGVAPTQENIASGAYKIVRPLALIYTSSAEMKPVVRAFLDFAKSPEGQRIAAAAF